MLNFFQNALVFHLNCDSLFECIYIDANSVISSVPVSSTFVMSVNISVFIFETLGKINRLYTE